MHPIETTYHLCTKGHHYAACHALMREERIPECVLKFPTVFAKRNGETIGFLGTLPNDKMVIAGPLVTKGGRNPIVVLRLVDVYDALMRQQGMKLYYFNVDPARSDAFSIERLKELGYIYWETIDNVAWFKKEL